LDGREESNRDVMKSPRITRQLSYYRQQENKALVTGNRLPVKEAWERIDLAQNETLLPYFSWPHTLVVDWGDSHNATATSVQKCNGNSRRLYRGWTFEPGSIGQDVGRPGRSQGRAESGDSKVEGRMR